MQKFLETIGLKQKAVAPITASETDIDSDETADSYLIERLKQTLAEAYQDRNSDLNAEDNALISEISFLFTRLKNPAFKCPKEFNHINEWTQDDCRKRAQALADGGLLNQVNGIKFRKKDSAEKLIFAAKKTSKEAIRTARKKAKERAQTIPVEYASIMLEAKNTVIQLEAALKLLDNTPSRLQKKLDDMYTALVNHIAFNEKQASTFTIEDRAAWIEKFKQTLNNPGYSNTALENYCTNQQLKNSQASESLKKYCSELQAVNTKIQNLQQDSRFNALFSPDLYNCKSVEQSIAGIKPNLDLPSPASLNLEASNNRFLSSANRQVYLTRQYQKLRIEANCLDAIAHQQKVSVEQLINATKKNNGRNTDKAKKRLIAELQIILDKIINIRDSSQRSWQDIFFSSRSANKEQVREVSTIAIKSLSAAIGNLQKGLPASISISKFTAVVRHGFFSQANETVNKLKTIEQAVNNFSKINEAAKIELRNLSENQQQALGALQGILAPKK